MVPINEISLIQASLRIIDFAIKKYRMLSLPQIMAMQLTSKRSVISVLAWNKLVCHWRRNANTTRRFHCIIEHHFFIRHTAIFFRRIFIKNTYLQYKHTDSQITGSASAAQLFLYAILTVCTAIVFISSLPAKLKQSCRFRSGNPSAQRFFLS